jgi:mannose/fructose/N-acetylgalactosamine-specific phosphotransferase system component IID
VQRKIDAGAVLSKIFATYREYARVLLTLAVGVAFVEALFRLSDSWILSLVGLVVSIVVSALFTGAVVELVNDTRDGRLDQSIGALIGQVTPVLFTLIIASILAALLTILGIIGCFVGAIAVYTLVSVTAPVVVVERLGAIDSIQRSWRMVWPNFWPVLLVLLVCWLISVVLGEIVVAIVGYGVVGAIVTFVVYLLLAPLSALASATLYFELLAIERGAQTAGPPPIAGLQDDPPPPPAPAF